MCLDKPDNDNPDDSRATDSCRLRQRSRNPVSVPTWNFPCHRLVRFIETGEDFFKIKLIFFFIILWSCKYSFNNKNEHFSGWASRYFGWNGNTHRGMSVSWWMYQYIGSSVIAGNLTKYCVSSMARLFGLPIISCTAWRLTSDDSLLHLHLLFSCVTFISYQRHQLHFSHKYIG